MTSTDEVTPDKIDTGSDAGSDTGTSRGAGSAAEVSTRSRRAVTVVSPW